MPVMRAIVMREISEGVLQRMLGLVGLSMPGLVRLRMLDLVLLVMRGSVLRVIRESVFPAIRESALTVIRDHVQRRIWGIAHLAMRRFATPKMNPIRVRMGTMDLASTVMRVRA